MFLKGGGAVAKLTDVQMEAMALRLQGLTIKEIAQELKQRESTVKNWFYRNEAFMTEYEAIRKESVERARDILVGYGPQAAKNIVSIAEGNKKPGNVSARTQLDANMDILDRIGLKPVEKQEVKAELDHNAEFIAEFKK
jgi:IS30 family transposase